MAWIQANVDEDGRLNAPEVVVPELAEFLHRLGRAADAGHLYRDPVAEAQRLVDAIKGFRWPWFSNDIQLRMEEYHLEQMASLHEVVVAADRQDEARQVAALMVRTRLTAVRRALKNDSITDTHREWLADAVSDTQRHRFAAADADELSEDARELLAQMNAQRDD